MFHLNIIMMITQTTNCQNFEGIRSPYPSSIFRTAYGNVSSSSWHASDVLLSCSGHIHSHHSPQLRNTHVLLRCSLSQTSQPLLHPHHPVKHICVASLQLPICNCSCCIFRCFQCRLFLSTETNVFDI